MKQSNPAIGRRVGKGHPADIPALMKRYYSSKGVSIKAFCKEHGIREWKFYAWHKQYRSSHSEPGGQQGFVPVEVVAAKTDKAADAELFAEVGAIKIYRPVPADYLKSLAG